MFMVVLEREITNLQAIRSLYLGIWVQFSVYSLSLSYIPVGYSRYSPIGYTGLPVGYLLAIYP